MELTQPVTTEDLRAAYPRDTANMEVGELAVMLEIYEDALRSSFGISRTDEDADQALRRAMLLGWPSFVVQVRQVSSMTAGTERFQAVYNRAGVVDFEWPSFVRLVLSRVGDPTVAAAAPHITQLVR